MIEEAISDTLLDAMEFDFTQHNGSEVGSRRRFRSQCVEDRVILDGSTQAVPGTLPTWVDSSPPRCPGSARPWRTAHSLTTYGLSPPDRVGPAYTALREALWECSGIRVHMGKTKVWNSGGVRPIACDMLERIARENEPRGQVRSVNEGSVCWEPLGHPDVVAAHLQKILVEHRTRLGKIPLLSDLQSAWALLLHCASGRANYQLRSVRPNTWWQSSQQGMTKECGNVFTRF